MHKSDHHKCRFMGREHVADVQGGDECVLASLQSLVGLAGSGEESRTKTGMSGLQPLLTAGRVLWPNSSELA